MPVPKAYGKARLMNARIKQFFSISLDQLIRQGIRHFHYNHDKQLKKGDPHG